MTLTNLRYLFVKLCL